ncbi:MAG TPA: flagellar hook-length control protein FliK [Gammaproteobacteria bacterium]|nr:flagellar hook-length control protein FliK [Gammaproteobacteria bacterium]
MLHYRCQSQLSQAVFIMEPTGPTSGIQRSPASGPSTPPAWQAGQQLRATVIESGIGRVLLSVGNRQLSAETSLLLEKGQELTLLVRSLGRQPVLSIVSRLQESPAAMALRLLLPRQQPAGTLLTSLLQLARTPNAPLPPAAAETLRRLVGSLPSTGSVQTPAGLRKAIADSGLFMEQRLLQAPAALRNDLKAALLRLAGALRQQPADGRTPSASDGAGRPAARNDPGTGTAAVRPERPAPGHAPPPARPTATPAATPTSHQVRRALQAAASLRTLAPASPGSEPAARAESTTPSPASAAAQPAPAPPLRGTVPVPLAPAKAALELLARLGELRAGLLQQTESVLARIQLQQLAALPREGERGLLEWLLELPLRRGDVIDLWSLRIVGEEAPRRRKQPGQRRWSVQLAFDLPGLGPVQAQVRLTGETVSARFWPEQPQTRALFDAHLQELRSALTGAGLEVAELECLQGPLPCAESPETPPVIDEQA